MRWTEGHSRLLEVFERNDELVQAREAEALGMPRQHLNDILAGRRGATVAHTIAIRRRYKIPVSAWIREVR